MPSASPMYTFANVFTEPATPFALSSDGTSINSPPGSGDNNNTFSNSSNHILNMDVKNGNIVTIPSSNNNGSVNGTGNSTCSYDPFKCLSAMAEQSLTGNFSSTPNITNISTDNPCRTANGISINSISNINNQSSSSHSRRENSGSSSTQYRHQDQFTQFQPCDRSNMYLSLSSTSPLSSSSSPPLSPSSSSCCMYNNTPSSSNPGTSSDFLTNDDAAFVKQSSPPNQNQSHDFLRNDSPFCLTPPANHNSVGGVRDSRAICAKNFPSCSSEQALEEGERLLSWTLQHPENWSCSEVLDWIFFVAQERRLDMQEFRGENFRAISGAHLCQMGLEEFISLEPNFGRIVYEMFRKLLCGVLFRKPTEHEHFSSPCVQMSPYSPVPCPSPKQPPNMDGFHVSPPSYQSSGTDMSNCNSMTTSDNFFKQERCNNLQNGGIDINSYDFDLDDTPCITTSQCHEQYQSEYGMYPAQYPQATPIRTSCCFPAPPFPAQLPRRRPGRPRVKSLMDDERTSKEKKVKNQHLWEFIYETLMNPMYNPQYLRWENQRDGVFRFVQSEAVAQLWGGRKNNENMTYEKLSRAMRHYYRRGILERVEGRRLVYKFSLKALERVREKRHAV